MGAMKHLATWVQNKVRTRLIRTPARVDERPVIAKARCVSCEWSIEATDWSHIPERCPRCGTLLTDKEV
jgi:predicted Zn-ribbon and HTH transcriptional regulator